jgi:hypothetical protein
LDTPAITPQILGAIQQFERPVVLDVGGDRQGARALGQFSPAIRQQDYVMYFVVNPYRPFTDTLDGLARSIAEIEASSRLQVSCLVSNPNLINETTVELLVGGHARIEGFARELGLAIAFVCVERRWVDALGSNHFAQPVLALDRHFVMGVREHNGHPKFRAIDRSGTETCAQTGRYRRRRPAADTPRCPPGSWYRPGALYPDR